jgi:hypothetical protein
VGSSVKRSGADLVGSLLRLQLLRAAQRLDPDAEHRREMTQVAGCKHHAPALDANIPIVDVTQQRRAIEDLLPSGPSASTVWSGDAIAQHH